MTDNEKLAQGLALAFVQASLSGMSESDRLEELKAIKDDADPSKPNTTTLLTITSVITKISLMIFSNFS